MLTLASVIAFIVLGTAILLCLFRLVRGPDAADRIIAFDTLYINAVALLITLGIRIPAGMFFDAALLIALTGFVGTAALAGYLIHDQVSE